MKNSFLEFTVVELGGGVWGVGWGCSITIVELGEGAGEGYQLKDIV